MATSNHLGYYKFEIENIALKTHSISFTKDNYRNTAISFHPLIGNVKHDVVMCNYKDKQCGGYLMGAPLMPHFEQYSFPFSKTLNVNVLKLLATKLRENPFADISINITFSKDSDKKLYEKKGQEIINYLVDKQSIDRDRLHVNIIKNTKKANVVEVVNYMKN